ncbi:hypothetical protein ACTVZO_42425 [Streptomyces sp. IBSNAI002]|uniref:hypothetical protein n=1 Tax=Streptomyces sp. IBSNAI002 TaxID=3457500 RepID=UPI003FD6664A
MKVDLVPPNRLATLARGGLGPNAPILERTPEPRRTELLMQVKLLSVAKRATDQEWLASRPRRAKASRTVRAALRLWSGQSDLIAETGADLDAAAMFPALEEEVGPRAEVEAAVRPLDELLPPGTRRRRRRCTVSWPAGTTRCGRFSPCSASRARSGRPPAGGG